jgi:tetratricopeptide (TPR) repeat protein
MPLNEQQMANLAAGKRTDISTLKPVTPEANPVQVSTPEPVQPVTPEVAIETPTPAPIIQPDFLQELRQRANVEVSSLDELKQWKDSVTQVNTLKQEQEALRQELEALRVKANENPFANELMKKRNELLLQGASKEQIKAFDKVNDIDLKALTPFELIKAQIQLEHGLSEKDTEILMKNRYKIDSEVNTPEEIAYAQVQMKIDSDVAIKALEKQKVEISTPPVNPAQANALKAEQERVKYIQSVEPVVKNYLTAYEPGKGFNLNGKTGSDAQIIDLPVPADFKSGIEKPLTDFVISQNINPSTEIGQSQIKNYIDAAFMQVSFKSSLQHVMSETTKAQLAAIQNPSVVNRGPENAQEVTNAAYEAQRKRLAEGPPIRFRR